MKPRKKAPKRPQIVEASPYDIPDVIMDLVSQICLAKDTREYRRYLGTPLSDTVYGKLSSDKKLEKEGIYHYFYRNRNRFSEHDFLWKLIEILRNLYKEIVNNEESTQARIVVAGIFDSGKSYFINTVFLGEEDFLPVSAERSTAISTSVHFSDKLENIQVKATNQKGVVVNLNENVLKLLRHQPDGIISPSGQIIMSVLTELSIVKPSNRFNGYIIIDTPGFDSGNESNAFNNKSDDQEAFDTLKNGDMMIWVHDVTRGNLDKKEIYFISQFKGPFAVMLSKGNLISPNTCESILHECYEQLKSELEEGNLEQLIDVFVYNYADEVGSLPEEEQYISYSVNNFEGHKIEDVLRITKHRTQYSYPSMTNLHNLFQYEIETAERKQVRIKNENIKYLENWEFYAHDMFKEEMKFKEDPSLASFCSSAEKAGAYKLMDSTNKQRIKQEIILKLIKDSVDQDIKKYNYLVKELSELSLFIDKLQEFERDLTEIIETGVDNYKKSIKEQDTHLDINSRTNIYEAIDSGNDLIFRKSIDGVDLKSSNKDGYTPLTYAVRSGNNTMVKYLLQFGANPCEFDARGRNAFHTAVEFQYRDICKILLGTEYAETMVGLKTKDDKDIWDLFELQSFKNWLNKEIEEIKNI